MFGPSTPVGGNNRPVPRPSPLPPPDRDLSSPPTSKPLIAVPFDGRPGRERRCRTARLSGPQRRLAGAYLGHRVAALTARSDFPGMEVERTSAPGCQRATREPAGAGP